MNADNLINSIKNATNSMLKMGADFNNLQKQSQQTALSDYKAWEDKTNAERIDSIAEYQSRIINRVFGVAKEQNNRDLVFWQKEQSSQELDKNIPYNGATGKPYTNLDNILMRSVMAIENYQEPIFMTMRQANIMGGVLKKTGNTTRNGKEEYVKGIKVVQVKTKEFVPELDANGNKQYEPAFKNGQPVMKKDGTQAMNVKGQTRELKEPMFESVTLYNVAQFDNLDRTKLKELDMESLNKNREILGKNAQAEKQFDFKYKSLEGKLLPETLKNLRDFTKATQTGMDFKPIIIKKEAKKEYVQNKEQGMNR
ncbi:ArdC-like ssDNA-binding domain-containing protein [Campylobacter troglodytis]|uniref:ArdC-like ssDNA-binding domain-containing protein n=1 Tax=Campylobacter troglodytis TaxID=654363 RepID=UPI001157C337|nr:ArdC-like ssDNA-binding domain-containing protein [Campylobacter troglodytis]TQR56273.1 hypothetical protein DMC01_09325 [Campylobacter troglodytis]